MTKETFWQTVDNNLTDEFSRFHTNHYANYDKVSDGSMFVAEIMDSDDSFYMSVVCYVTLDIFVAFADAELECPVHADKNLKSLMDCVKDSLAEMSNL